MSDSSPSKEALLDSLREDQYSVRPTTMLSSKTPRLSLREFTIDDVEAFYALESNPANARYQEWPPRTREQSMKLVQDNIEAASKRPRSIIELAVETLSEQGEPMFIGRVGCFIADDHLASLWFSFLPEAQGQGYATEAVKALICLLENISDRTMLTIETLNIECDPRNIGSRKIAERLGFRKTSEMAEAYECKGEMVGSIVYERSIAV